ncbi:MAG: 50S ribosomal protein L18 [Gammaproteobacteria bacterium]|nr:50S ribosomal protein L18 [Gammaproteobacteria bacterium]
MNKELSRKRRATKTRATIRRTKSQRVRLVVSRSNPHIYAQIIETNVNGDLVLASASTLDKELKPTLKGSKTDKAFQVGKLLADRAKAKNILDVAFDRAGYRYHGRVKALADGARDGGLNF